MFLSIGKQSNIESENELRLRGLKTFVNHIKQMELGVTIVEDIMETSLADTDILWILWPDRWFMPPEISGVRTKIEEGMGLLTTSEWSGIEYNAEILNSILEDAGIKFNKDRIIDPINAYTQSEIAGGGEGEGSVIGGKVVEFIKIKDFSRHPIVGDLTELAYYSGCSLTAAPEHLLAKSKFVSFSDIDGDKKWSQGEKIGSACVAAFSELGEGRLVAVGDTSLFTDKYITFKDNGKFMENTVNWLLKQL